jgi:hypothetical protein
MRLAIAGGICVQPMKHRAQAGVDRATRWRVISRREVDLRAVDIDWASRRINDRDRTCSKLRNAIDKNVGNCSYAIGAADLIQSDTRIAQFAALRRYRCQIEVVFAYVDSDDRGVARDLEVQELG